VTHELTDQPVLTPSVATTAPASPATSSRSQLKGRYVMISMSAVTGVSIMFLILISSQVLPETGKKTVQIY